MPRQTTATQQQAVRPRREDRTGRDTVIAKELFRRGPLCQDFERLASPAVAMTEADIVSLLLKYFFAVLYPGSEEHAVALEEISLQLGRFYDLCAEAGPEEEQAESPVEHTGALPLRMLGDLPRTAHIFRAVANRPLPPALVQDPYLGIDCGTGSGILLAAAWLQAKRNGVARTRLFGIERDSAVADRTGRMLQALGIGRTIIADARDPAAYAGLPDGPVAYIANETLATTKIRLTAAPFCTIHAVVFSELASRLGHAFFFPEALIVRDRKTEPDVVLSKNNRFQIPRNARHNPHRPRSLVIEGRLTNLWQVGKSFRPYFPQAWLASMPRRW